jgi:hypothetical protein
MGYSIGSMEGNILHIETRGFTSMFYDSNGAPVSEEARLIERMWLDDQDLLHREYEFIDPRFYTRSLTNNGTLVKREIEPIESYDCDPHLFYRILEISEELDDYFDRAKNWR